MRFSAILAPASSLGERPWSRWLYPAALMLTVFIASGRGQVAGPAIVNFDKVAHFSIFGLLATLIVRSPGIRFPWAAVLLVSAYGIGDEIRQSFTPGRSVALADWLADTLGAATAVGLYAGWAWYRRLLETRVWPRPRACAPG